MGLVNRRAAPVLLVVLMLVSPACGSSSAARTPSPSGSPTALGKVSDWLEYHGTSARTGQGPSTPAGAQAVHGGCNRRLGAESAGRGSCGLEPCRGAGARCAGAGLWLRVHTVRRAVRRLRFVSRLCGRRAVGGRRERRLPDTERA